MPLVTQVPEPHLFTFAHNKLAYLRAMTGLFANITGVRR